MKRQLLFITLMMVSALRTSIAQTNAGTVTGTIKDIRTGQAISFASIALLRSADTSLVSGVNSDEVGNFKFELVGVGTYLLKISLLGYQTLRTETFVVNASQPFKSFGTIRMRPSTTSLNTITVEGKEKRVEQNGDTVGYNAKAYKTNPDANAEDLVTKMPGITSDNGQVKAHGENVKQVLVDGKPFFGDDPNMALKNLPAEVIDKIQVYDKASDQAQFTGFDDGNANKTINIITKPGRNNGQFGKVYAGYGTDDTYIAGGNLNLFKGERRISILVLSNNINQQNFASQDLLGALGSGGGGRGGMGGMGGMGGRPGGGMGMGGGPDGSAASNFLVGQQAGITTTQAIGINYSDKWSEKIKVSGSYFFNLTDNTNSSVLSRQYVSAKDSGLYYNENNASTYKNYNQRINFRLDYKVDSFNSFTITPKISLQDNHTNSSLDGINQRRNALIAESKTNTANYTFLSGYTLSNNILYQHKFSKFGRTISWNIGTDANDKKGNSSIYSLSNYYYLNDTSLTNQRATQTTNGYTLSTNITYTEPIDSFSRLMFTYSPSYSDNSTDKETNSHNLLTDNYSLLDTALTNKFKSIYFYNKGGIGYNYNKKKVMLMATINTQYATLNGNQDFPVAFTANKYFFNILPQAMFNYKFDRGTNLRIFYRTSTNTPSITQLQNVINNTNPLLLTTGNPDLKQSFDQTLIMRYGKTNSQKATGLFAFLYGNYTQDYIGNSTIVPSHDTIVEGNIVLKRGSQLSKSVNLQGYMSTRAFLTYAIPVSKIKCNLNLNGAFVYSRTPSLINGVNNFTNNYLYTGGIGLTSNISEKIDFNIQYNANYSIADNTLQTQSSTSYFYHTASLKLNWIIWKGLVFNTNLTHTYYSGLSTTLDKPYELLNISIAYKFLKKQNLEVKASVFDALTQNTSINRNITDTYIEDSQTKVLTRYYMLTLTYTLKKFKTEEKKPERQ